MIFHQSHNSLSNYNYNAFVYTDTVWDYHFHRNPELIYVIRGAVNCTVNNRPYRLTAGQFGLCLSYDMHSYHPEPDTEYWVLVFSEDYVRFISKQLAGKTGASFPFRCRQAVEQFISHQLIRNPAPSTLTLKSCLYAIMEEFLSQIALIDKSTKETRIVSFVSDYVQQHHTQRLTLSDLATELGYDYNYMSRYFHSTFNMTFSDFVNIYRLETATKLLEDTDDSVTAIAFKSGFQSVRAFNNFFKKTTQQSPSQYRKASRR
ncbi:MAG: helix-turn-helix transcriptional regulator [Oscillospiraceae bacterium]|nr:helix-turn-helix transcriptional regulator [Oscillospiraceae bacterium]